MSFLGRRTADLIISSITYQIEHEANAVELVRCIVGQKPEKKEVHLHLKDSEEVAGFLRKLTQAEDSSTSDDEQQHQETSKRSSLATLLATDPLNA